VKLNPIVIDFETKSIEGRPDYPPVPVGVSIQMPGERKPHYYSWGHPFNNNCSKADAVRALKLTWKCSAPLLFHHAKFDIDVAQTHMGMGSLDWQRVHDTLYLLFLNNPHARSFQLKPNADELLDMPPVEQEAVRQWLVDRKIVRRNDKKWGAHIAEAPGDLVGQYAAGDCLRTLGLFKRLYPVIDKLGLCEAYDRERELMPILLENERQGMRVDQGQLRHDVKMYNKAMENVETWLRRRLKSKDLNFNQDEDVAEVLNKQKIVTEWELTETGQRSTSKKNLKASAFSDKRVFKALGYRNRLLTCLSTFMNPWLKMAEKSDGLIFTNWNQVRQNNFRDATKGTRTGRLSSNPNFQNIPKDWYDKDDDYEHPKHLTLPELPNVRGYVLPDKGGKFIHRDYNQQELRIAAHFENGALLQAYLKDPKVDVHNLVRDTIYEVAEKMLERRAVKVMNFGILYGRGVPAIADALQVSYVEAKELKKAHAKGLPDLVELAKDLKDMGKAGEPVRTWGKRMYFSEPPREIDNQMKRFDYKLLNYLVQGSAADCTKQAIINYHKLKKNGRFLVTVHDETNISAPEKAVSSEMKLLREAMESVKFDLPMLSDGKTGSTWGNLKPWKE
jgi:DNA polymerase I